MEMYSGSTTWATVTCGDGGVSLIDDSTNPLTVYANCIGDSFLKSTDGGATFNTVQNGINLSDRTNWTPPAAIDPSNGQRLYFGTSNVYQTVNGAALWTEISPGFDVGRHPFGVGRLPSQRQHGLGRVYGQPDQRDAKRPGRRVGHLDECDWNQYAPAAISDRDRGRPATGQHRLRHVFRISGYGDNLGHVFMTTNAGASWTDISGNLPNIPADDIVIDPLVPGTMYVATDFGVFYSTNGGTAWAALVTGLPRVAVTSLKLHPSRNLFAATHGRSVWETNVSSVTSIPSIIGLSPGSVVAGAAGFNMTVNGGAFTNTAIVQWNGVDLPTTFASTNQLTATVPSSDLLVAGTATVTVIIPGASVSNGFIFTIETPCQPRRAFLPPLGSWAAQPSP